MVLQILIVISIILQLIAVVVAIGLTRKTKYNISWLLFILALILMCLMRLSQYVLQANGKEWFLPSNLIAWAGVVTSLCMAVGIFYVGKIFNNLQRLDHQRKLTERRILTTIINTEEKERERLSKELHDGLGPLLSSAKISLSELAKTQGGDIDKELLRNISYVIDEAVRCLREISNNLSPHTLNSFGLSKALNNFVGKCLVLNGIKNVDIKFQTNMKSERFGPNVEIILYRVVCELIMNSLRHSNGDLITLDMNYNNNVITIHYSDNGKGFDPSAVMDTGMGLSNIASRIGSLNSKVDIRSEKNKGMTADISVNLLRAEDVDYVIKNKPIPF